MTQEQKAKAYDEAIERAEKALEVLGTDKCEGARQIFSLFPELRESEDERIRKGIIKMIYDIAGGFPFEKHGIIKKEALAWLEKQGQKPAWSEEDEAHINSIIAYLIDYKIFVYEEDINVANGVQKELDWLVSLKQRIGG